MKTIIFFNNKGGVGKTASVTSVAHMLASQYNKKVLIVDLDPQMNTTSMFNEVNFMKQFFEVYKGEKSGTDKSVEDLLLDTELDIHECIKKTEYDNLDIIPSYLTLSEAEERMKADVRTPQQFKLKEHLEKIQDEYDYCIIDTSPSVSIININGLVAADELYVPLRCDGGSLLGAAIVMNLYKVVSRYNSKLKMGGMFFTQWNGRKNVSKSVYNLLNEVFGQYIIPVNIGTSKNVEESSLMQIPLLAYDSGKNKSKVTEDYLKLTEYIFERI
jgi:chromosome partitioning protein